MIDGKKALVMSQGYTDTEISKVILGIQGIDVDNSDKDHPKVVITLKDGTKKELIFEQYKPVNVEIGKNTQEEFTLILTNKEGNKIETPNLRSKAPDVEIVKESDYVMKIKFTDDTGSITTDNIKGDSTYITNNAENAKNIKKLDIHNIKDGVETVTTTDNLMGNSTKVAPNKNNVMDKHERTYKIDYYEINDKGEEVLRETSENLASESLDCYPDPENNNNNYKLVIETLKGKEKVITKTDNLLGKKWFSGTEVYKGDDEYVIQDVKNSTDLDLYINTRTQDVFQRIDTKEIQNRWVYVTNIRGNDNYEIAVEEGYIGTRADWLASLTGQVNIVKKVFDKPDIMEDDTELKCWYYYQKGENAWDYETKVSTEEDYPIGNYSFFRGTKYYNIVSEHEIPSKTDKEKYLYYVRFNEKYLTATSIRMDLETGETIEIGTIPCTVSAEVPEGYDLVHTDFNELGTWYQTTWVGATKQNCDEISLTTGQSLDGLVTTDTFNEVIGTNDLKTTDKTVKGSINEINKLLRTDENKSLNDNLKTKEKIEDVVGAVNYLEEKNHTRIEQVTGRIEELAEKIRKKETNVLKEFNVYCEGITDAPDGTNGWGFAVIKVTQDNKYANIIYIDTDTNTMWKKECINSVWIRWKRLKGETTPIGSIMPYYGRAYGLEVPEGWQLCDGSEITDLESPINGMNTPNLIYNYLSGAPKLDEYVGMLVGSNYHTLSRSELPNTSITTSGKFTPSGTVILEEDGEHNHKSLSNSSAQLVKTGWKDTSPMYFAGTAPYSGYNGGTPYTSNDGKHAHTASFTGTQGNISTTFNLNGNVTQTEIDNRPSTVLVDYIMKIK